MVVSMLRKKAFRSIFRTYMLLLFLFLVMAGALFFRQNRTENLQYYRMDAERIASAMEGQFREIQHVGITLPSAVWIKRLMEPGEIFADTFDAFSKEMYRMELSRYIAVSSYLSDIHLIYPEQDTVVTSLGWMNISSYQKYLKTSFGVPYEDLLKSTDGYQSMVDLSAYSAKTKTLMLAKSLEMTASPRGTMIIFISQSQCLSHLKLLADERLLSLSMEDMDGKTLLHYEKNVQEKGYTVKIPSNCLKINYSFKYPSLNYLNGYGGWFSPINLFIYLAVLVFAVVLAYILAIVSYRPLRSVLKKLSQYSSKAEGEHEYMAIQSMVTDLYTQTEMMRSQVSVYQEAAGNHLLTQLLRGYFEEDIDEDELEKLEIHYNAEQYFIVMLVDTSGTAKKALNFDLLFRSVRQFLKEINQSHRLAAMNNRDVAVIFDYDEVPDNSKDLSWLSAQLQEYLHEELNENVEVRLGKAYQGFIGISKSYQELKESRFSKISDHIGSPSDYYYPTDWEIQLIKTLKKGDFRTSSEILKTIREENEKRFTEQDQSRLFFLLSETADRVISELTCDTRQLIQLIKHLKDMSNDSEERWRALQQIYKNICQQTSGYLLIEYVKANFTDTGISLKQLAAEFRMTVPAVSKTFKEYATVNFYDYVTGLRMETAKQLLLEKKYTISYIAKKVGYENDYSFKRAFMRNENIKPRDFLEQNSHM